MDGERAQPSTGPPQVAERLAERFDRRSFDPPQARTRIRVEVRDGRTLDALVERGTVRLEAPAPDHPADAVLRADTATWERILAEPRAGFELFQQGHLDIRRNLHLGVGFVVATAGARDPARPRARHLNTRAGQLSFLDAGEGEAVVLLHGLGATKASLVPTVAALVDRFRCVAPDLPGAGESAKPLHERYDSAHFAGAVVALLDALGIERAHLVGNSMGGRAAIEVALRAPERVGRLALLAPSLAWKRRRAWAPLLRLVRPELGLLQPTPRALADRVVRRLIGDADRGWRAAGVDEFLRIYCRPRGRAAFYAAARRIYLEEPWGPDGFWTRLGRLSRPALFVWGTEDPVIPYAFRRHVADTLPAARHVELDCGHVPQLESPDEAHAAVLDFLTEASA